MGFSKRDKVQAVCSLACRRGPCPQPKLGEQQGPHLRAGGSAPGRCGQVYSGPCWGRTLLSPLLSLVFTSALQPFSKDTSLPEAVGSYVVSLCPETCPWLLCRQSMSRNPSCSSVVSACPGTRPVPAELQRSFPWATEGRGWRDLAWPAAVSWLGSGHRASTGGTGSLPGEGQRSVVVLSRAEHGQLLEKLPTCCD